MRNEQPPRRRQTSGLRTPLPPARGKEMAPPPTPKEIRAANSGAYAGETRTVKKVGGNKILKAVLASGAVAGGGAIAYEAVPPFHQAVDSAFLDHIKGKSSESSISPEVFDNRATRGVKSERNTIPMSREEYQKVAPPTIDRENRKEVPGEFTIYGTDRVSKLTLEQNTSINALIYVKTPEGNIRETTYTKVSNPGEVTGVYPAPVLFPGCGEFLGEGEEIQAGDIFPAPISGDVYYTAPTYYNYYKGGERIEKGSFIYASYAIIGEYIDKEGNKFMIRVGINTLGASGSAITKPLVPSMTNSSDLVKKVTVKRPSGIEEIEHQAPREDEIPKVRVRQGDDLFKFVTQPPFQRFSNASSIKAQLRVGLSYSDIDANGIANTFGGENCTHPTLDNKAIVLK